MSRAAAILRQPAMRAAIAEEAGKRSLTGRRELDYTSSLIASQLSEARLPEGDADFFADHRLTEAIILEVGRPVLFIKDNIVEKASLKEVESLIAPVRKKFAKPISAVGRIELLDHDTFEWCGTGWRLDEDHIITNRHVALEFAQKQGSKFSFRYNQDGRRIRALIDFKEEYGGADSAEHAIADILWIAPDDSDSPDMAILRVAKGAKLPDPLGIAAKDAAVDADIAIVGYPARDSRNNSGVMSNIFNNIYDVKRFSYGKIVTSAKNFWYLTHDASTLGGNSGSCVFDLSTQNVVGLHFGGRYRKTNYAVKASVIKQLVARRNWIPVTRESLSLGKEAFRNTVRTVASMKGRKGFDPGFLGKKAPMPTPGKSHSVLPTDFPGNALPYTHFSILMSKSRRFPIITAENLDGALKYNLKRNDRWGFDPRIPKEAQVGHAEFYGPQPFDKGHMVRRENPGWGETEEEARLGEDDTFVYTNAIPQMPQLNQHTWLSLENYILTHTKTQGFRISVFTGPVFRESDPAYGDTAVQVCVDFWKVVVCLDSDTQEILSSSYLLTQEDIMPQEGFRFGAFKTYQVPITKIEKEADIRFSKAIRDADVFGGESLAEMVHTGRFLEINGAADIYLG